MSGKLTLFFLFVTLLLFQTAAAQVSVVRQPLVAGQSLHGQIKGGESQSFSISLAADQYAELSIEQRGSILLATLFDPQGKEIIQMDYPGGGYGPINLATIAASAGDYRLEITSVNKWANAANYDVVLAALRQSTTADQAMVDALLSFAEAQKFLSTGQAAAAIEPFNRALSYWQASANFHWQAVTQYALSQAYRSLGNRPKTEESLNETLQVLAQHMAPNDWRLKASALNDLGPIYAAAGQPEKALGVLNEALTLYASNQDRRGQASALNNLATTHARAGDFFLARELVEKALAFRTAENDKPGMISLLNGLGAISDRLGEPDEALNYFTQALRSWDELGETSVADRGHVAALLNNLAFESDKLGKWDQAIDYYDKTLDKYDAGDPNRIATLDNKGELYAALGNPVKARECYDEALALLAAGGKPDLDVKAGLLVHLGQLALAEGDLAKTIKNFEDARSLQPGKPKLADVLTNLGAAFALQGDLEKAIEAYQSALEIQLKLKDQRGQALTLQKRGEARTLLGLTSEALDDLNHALGFWRAVKDQRGEAATLLGIARVERARGNLTAALASSGDAISVIESLRTSVSSRQLRASYFGNQADYYELDVDLKMQLSKTDNRTDYRAAAFESSEKARSRVLLEALSEAGLDRTEFSRTSDPNLAGLIEQRLDLIAKFTAKAEARTKLLSSAHSSPEIAIIDKQITSISEQSDQLEARLRSHSPRYASLTKSQPSSLAQIQQQLDADTILLKYALGEKRSYAWVVSKESIDGFELAPRDQIERLARKVTDDLTARNRDEPNETFSDKVRRVDLADKDYVEDSAALSKAVLEPVAAMLGNKRLAVVADGALQLVPFGALPVMANSAITENAQFSSNRTATISLSDSRPPVINRSGPIPLITEHEITYSPSASVLALQRRELANRKPAPLAVAVLADPVFDVADIRVAEASSKGNRRRNPASPSVSVHSPAGPAPALAPNQKESASTSDSSNPTLATALRDVGLNGHLRRLDFSRQEALAIARSAPANQSFSALGFRASRKTATNPELSKYQIIHFATHGVLDLEHPELSGIVLSLVNEKGEPQDGYLRLHDIYNLNLPAELIVLSACQTGIGKQIKGEGLIALTRGFMYAGAKSVVASLWKVDDPATAELMAEFYKQMFTNKLKPAAALREAQRNIAKQKRYQSPYYWAGFFLQGDWN